MQKKTFLPNAHVVNDWANFFSSYRQWRSAAARRYKEFSDCESWREEMRLLSPEINLTDLISCDEFQEKISSDFLTFSELQSLSGISNDWAALLTDSLFNDLKIIEIGASSLEPFRVKIEKAHLQDVMIQKIIIVVKQNVNVTIIIDENISLSNLFCSVTIVAQSNSQVNIVHALGKKQKSAFYNYVFHVYRDAQICFGLMNNKSGYERIAVETFLHEPGAATIVAGFYTSTDGQKTVILTNNYHHAGETTSVVQVHGILAQNAQTLFRGVVDIEVGCSGVQAEQRNKNIVLSRNARSISLPLLQVKTDQVKCAHGSAVGQLDEEQLLYLQSRAISYGAAQEMLLRAFIADSLNQLNKEVRNELEKRLQENEQSNFSYSDSKQCYNAPLLHGKS